MAQYFVMHPRNPQARLVRATVDIVTKGGVIVYPTDSCYALGCALENKAGRDRICRLRELDPKHPFTLVCRDLSDLATYAQVDNSAYRILRAHTPGPYTFVLPATHEVPRRLLDPKRRTIGVRVPDHVVTQALLAQLGAPLMSVSLILPGDEAPLSDPMEIRARLEHAVDVVIDGGPCPGDLTSVVVWEGREFQVHRAGVGDTSMFAPREGG
ncbi:threonylcarbamoyl-AMP synthase [Acidiferrobacter sp. SPIII_3]|jgi:tRNA threonylcarbamoyl adenosine modification protein (Sua5/YciO/YrdC/YwlC family)|uniref:L-threonylcarbamoyladenylate synthase n=1 Tax=Acidiferrobacter sp. SPIII_3 TaxID=1281578 RepID=UPI000D7339FD|nr:L-threonylcarbamoyladenylate synthase [Acidiferrobacter sp. SPIII_3]AWP23282.1 threonylcarbamoyl-AMP synthase [Acidiferrobacter sp. SPIII_3]